MNQVSLVPPDRMGAGVEPGTSGEQAVRHPAPDSNGFIFWLDEPQSWRTASRWLRLAGWCLHVSGAPAVTRLPAFFTSAAGSSIRWEHRSMAFAPESVGNFFPQTSTFPAKTCS